MRWVSRRAAIRSSRRLRCSQQRTMDFVGPDMDRWSDATLFVDGFGVMPSISA